MIRMGTTDEGRGHLCQLFPRSLGDVLKFLERFNVEPGDEAFKEAPIAEHPHVREGRSGQQPPDEVKAQGADGTFVSGLRGVWITGQAAADVLADRFVELIVGVKQRPAGVQVAFTVSGVEQSRLFVETVIARNFLPEGNVARRFLQR